MVICYSSLNGLRQDLSDHLTWYTMAHIFQMKIRDSGSKGAFVCSQVPLTPSRRVSAFRSLLAPEDVASQAEIQPEHKNEALPGVCQALTTQKSWEGMLKPEHPALPCIVLSVLLALQQEYNKDIRTLGHREQGEISTRLDTGCPLSLLRTYSLQ